VRGGENASHRWNIFRPKPEDKDVAHIERETNKCRRAVRKICKTVGKGSREEVGPRRRRAKR